jgi:hypothetical protein
MINNINCIFTLLIVKGTKPKLILATIFFVFYTDATQRSPMYGGDRGSQGFPTSAYCCTPLQPPYTSTSPNQWLTLQNSYEQLGSLTEEENKNVHWIKKCKRSREMWWVLIHGTSLYLHGLYILTCSRSP